MTLPARLEAFGEAIGGAIANLEGVWVASVDLPGCWPIPDGSVTFGKGSSCVVGETIAVSCAEVELTLRARRAGWTGGWVSTFRPDSRFPSAWREALIDESTARRLLAAELPGRITSSGMPDLIFSKDGQVVTAECKRLRGRYRGNDCAWRSGGDAFKPNQERWATEALNAGLPPDAIVQVWWTRVDQSRCA